MVRAGSCGRWTGPLTHPVPGGWAGARGGRWEDQQKIKKALGQPTDDAAPAGAVAGAAAPAAAASTPAGKAGGKGRKRANADDTAASAEASAAPAPAKRARGKGAAAAAPAAAPAAEAVWDLRVQSQTIWSIRDQLTRATSHLKDSARKRLLLHILNHNRCAGRGCGRRKRRQQRLTAGRYRLSERTAPQRVPVAGVVREPLDGAGGRPVGLWRGRSGTPPATWRRRA